VSYQYIMHSGEHLVYICAHPHLLFIDEVKHVLGMTRLKTSGWSIIINAYICFRMLCYLCWDYQTCLFILIAFWDWLN
ncbi:Unknown protein, partial [Striga hermonthica]